MLSINNLNVRYGGVNALRGISLNVEKGEFVAIIGSNGAGKTTLLRTISGLKRACGGTILFDDQDIIQKPPEKIVAQGLCHCPERRRVFAQLSVLDNLRLGTFASRPSRKEMGERIERIFGYFPKLDQRKKQLAGTLSGGEQQMLAVGRALMATPKLLMLDEPSLGLAPVIVQELAKIFTQINKEGTTVILVEQNAVLALRLAQKLFIMETGCIVKQGSSAELMGDESIQKAYLGGGTGAGGCNG